MNAALWISKTGLSAQDAEMSAIANNIANVNTTGFKRDRVMFQDLFYQTQEAPGAMLDQNNIMPTGLQFGSGVRIVGTRETFTEGNVRNHRQRDECRHYGAGVFAGAKPTAISLIPATATCR